MISDDNGPRLYGTPDPDNPEPPAEGGMCGERPGQQRDDAPVFTRVAQVNGHDVVIEETSGVAYAEEVKRSGDEQHRKE